LLVSCSPLDERGESVSDARATNPSTPFTVLRLDDLRP
jgi:hypothetical protein